MKIGDEVYIHGYVDEIRNDVVIIRNNGGYFGTIPEEVLLTGIEYLADRKTEPQTSTISEDNSTISEKVQLKDEPKTERPCDNCQEFDCYGCEHKQTERSE